MSVIRNAGHLGLNMLHRRSDGTIGWVDPRGNRDYQPRRANGNGGAG